VTLKRWPIIVLTVLALVASSVPAAISVSAAPAQAPEAQAAVARNATLKLGIGGRIDDPTNFNIYAPGVNRGNGIHQLAYEYLFYQNLQTGEFVPWIGESYQYNDDYTALTVKLRQGVTWSDGQPFTPDDIVFTYNMLRSNPSMLWSAESSAAVKSVDVVDPLTVRFNLTKSNPRFHLTREAFPGVGIWGGITIVPKHIWEGKDPVSFKNNPPIGTGPYKLKEATQQALTWERRADWWGTKVFGVQPAPQEVTWTFVGSETNAALALANNDIDMPEIGVLTLGSYLNVRQRNPNVSAWTSDAPYAWLDPCPRAMMVQNAHPPLDNPQVRWAISYAIDRNAIANLAYEGATVPTWGIWPFYNALQPYFDAIQDLRQQYPSDAYDPDKSAQLFQQAGVNPADIHLKYVVDGTSNEEVKVSQVLADQLRAAGFQVDVQNLQGSVLQDTILKGDYDIKVHSFCPGYIPENLELFESKNYVPLGQNAPWFERNSFRYQNPNLDAVVDKMLALPPDDQQSMISLYHDAMSIWLADLPAIPVTQAPALVPFNSTYWSGFPNSDNAWNMPVSWWATFNIVITGYPNGSGGWVGGLKPKQ
jgi:peptide/nickel transport system substrate-binding protein